MQRTEILTLTPDELRQEITEAVSAALKEQARDLKALRVLVSSAQGFYTARTLAVLLGVSAETIKYRWAKRGLKAYRPGKDPIYLREDVLAFIRQHPDAADASLLEDPLEPGV